MLRNQGLTVPKMFKNSVYAIYNPTNKEENRKILDIILIIDFLTKIKILLKKRRMMIKRKMKIIKRAMLENNNKKKDEDKKDGTNTNNDENINKKKDEDKKDGTNTNNDETCNNKKKDEDKKDNSLAQIIMKITIRKKMKTKKTYNNTNRW